MVPCSKVRWQGSEELWRRGMCACDVAMAFACVPSRGLPRVLIKITSGSSHMLISGALKDDANTSACSWEVGEGGAFICVRLCGGSTRVCLCVRAIARDCNSCWGGGKDFGGEPALCSVVSMVWSWRDAN